MKRTSLKLRIAVALLLVVMMLFSVVAVTAFAATPDAADEPDLEYTGDWYKISYTDPNGLNVQISAQYWDYLGTNKEAIYDLFNQIKAIALRYVKQNVSLFGTNDAASALVYSLASSEIDPQSSSSGISSSDKELLKTMLSALGVNLDDFDESKPVKEALEEFVQNEENRAVVQNNIETYANLGIDTAVKAAAMAYAATQGSSANVQEIVEKFQDVVDVVVENIDSVKEVIDIVYESEDDKPESVITIVNKFETTAPSELKQQIVKPATDGAEAGKSGDITSAFTKEDIQALLLTFKSISVDGEKLVTLNGLDVGFNYDLAKKLVRDLPMPGELANYTDEQFANLFNYDLKVEFAFLSLELDLTVGFSGDCSHIRRVMDIASRYVDVSIGANNTLVVGLTVPDEFADIVLRAAKTNKIPDHLKHKIFAALDKTGDDVQLFLSEDLTFEDIISVLKSIDYKELLDVSFVKKYATKLGIYDNLEDIDTDKLIEKVSEYGDLYNRAMKYVVKAFDYVPDRFMDKTVSDFYNSETNQFHASEDVVITEDRANKVIDKAFSVYENHVDGRVEDFLDENYPKYAEFYEKLVSYAKKGAKYLVSNVFEHRDSITVGLDLTVEFQDIYQVTFHHGDDRTVRGFLPVGADVDFFGNNADVYAWVDENGNIVTQMPKGNVHLYPLGYGFKADVQFAENAYDVFYNPNKSYTLIASVSEDYLRADNAEVTYAWYNEDGVLVATGKTLEGLKNVADSGKYYCVVTLVGDTALQGVEIEGISAKSETLEVLIKKAIIDISDLPAEWAVVGGEWKDANKNSIVYTGSPIELKLDMGAYAELVTVNITGNKATAIGEYTANFTFEYDTANYVLEGGNRFSAINGYVWSIVAADPVENGDDKDFVDGKVNIQGNGAENFVVTDKTADYATFTITVGNKVGKVIVAYDITYDAHSGEYVITFVIPEGYEDDETLKIYHIDGNNVAEQIENAVLNGDGTITFTATDFSVYAIVAFEDTTVTPPVGPIEPNPPVDPNPQDPPVDDEEPKSKWWIWLLVALGVLLVAAGTVLAVVMIKRKKAAEALQDAIKEEGDPVPTTPSVGEAAVEVPEEVTSADAESPESEVTAIEPITEVAEEAEPVVEEIAEKNAVEEPAVEETVADEVVAEEPVAEEPVAEVPVAEEPVVEEPVAEEPVAEVPVAEEPVAEEPVVEEPVVEEPVAEEPVVEEPVKSDRSHVVL